MSRPIAVLCLPAVAACASSGLVWQNPGKTQQDFYQDNSQCMAMAGAGQQPQVMQADSAVLRGWNMGAAAQSAENQRTIHQQCMMGKGWWLVKP